MDNLPGNAGIPAGNTRVSGRLAITISDDWTGTNKSPTPKSGATVLQETSKSGLRRLAGGSYVYVTTNRITSSPQGIAHCAVNFPGKFTTPPQYKYNQIKRAMSNSLSNLKLILLIILQYDIILDDDCPFFEPGFLTMFGVRLVRLPWK